MRFHRDDALIVVDVQRDFCPGGALEIAGGDDIVPIINRLMAEAAASGACIVASRDWHPKDHASFNAWGGVWPEHCIQESDGAKFHEGLRLPPDALVISKGADLHKDQYSAFDGTGLTDELRRRGIRRVIICGLALDVCVRASALDAARAGFETLVMRQATRPVSNQDGERAIIGNDARRRPHRIMRMRYIDPESRGRGHDGYSGIQHCGSCCRRVDQPVGAAPRLAQS